MLSKFKKFESQKVILNGIKTLKYGSSQSIANLNNKISSYIISTYSKYGYRRNDDSDLNVNGNIINGQYLSKMINNYTVFKAIIRENRIKNEKDFYEFVLNNMDDIYGYDGKFFKEHTLPIIIITHRKGNETEKKSIKLFKKWVSNEYKLKLNIKYPSIEEDVSGIDAKFEMNNRNYTIQIKPFTSYKTEGNQIYIKTEGSLSLNTNYLILFKNESEYFIMRNPNNNKITISGNYFLSDIDNVAFTPLKIN